MKNNLLHRDSIITNDQNKTIKMPDLVANEVKSLDLSNCNLSTNDLKMRLGIQTLNIDSHIPQICDDTQS